jgi:hypothetical protein
VEQLSQVTVTRHAELEGGATYTRLPTQRAHPGPNLVPVPVETVETVAASAVTVPSLVPQPPSQIQTSSATPASVVTVPSLVPTSPSQLQIAGGLAATAVTLSSHVPPQPSQVQTEARRELPFMVPFSALTNSQPAQPSFEVRNGVGPMRPLHPGPSLGPAPPEAPTTLKDVCSQCGSIFGSDFLFCDQCGKARDAPNAATVQHNTTIYDVRDLAKAAGVGTGTSVPSQKTSATATGTGGTGGTGGTCGTCGAGNSPLPSQAAPPSEQAARRVAASLSAAVAQAFAASSPTQHLIIGTNNDFDAGPKEHLLPEDYSTMSRSPTGTSFSDNYPSAADAAAGVAAGRSPPMDQVDFTSGWLATGNLESMPGSARISCTAGGFSSECPSHNKPMGSLIGPPPAAPLIAPRSSTPPRPARFGGQQ